MAEIRALNALVIPISNARDALDLKSNQAFIRACGVSREKLVKELEKRPVDSDVQEDQDRILEIAYELRGLHSMRKNLAKHAGEDSGAILEMRG